MPNISNLEKFKQQLIQASIMTDTRRDFTKECKTMFNDICIVGDMDLVRLVGCSYDLMDMYYHVRFPNGFHEVAMGRDMHMTAVGPCVSLKGIYPRYDALETHFSLNGCPPVPEFIETVSTPEENEKMYGKRGTYWDNSLEDENDCV
jgi:hypothetical protein